MGIISGQHIHEDKRNKNKKFSKFYEKSGGKAGNEVLFFAGSVYDIEL